MQLRKAPWRARNFLTAVSGPKPGEGKEDWWICHSAIEDSAAWLRINSKMDVSSTGRLIQCLEIDTAAQQQAAEAGTQQQLQHRICPSPTRNLASVFSLPRMVTELKVVNGQNWISFKKHWGVSITSFRVAQANTPDKTVVPQQHYLLPIFPQSWLAFC